MHWYMERDMTDDPKGPVEDDLNDEELQDDSTDLPEPLVGNEEDDDMEETEDVKQDGQTG